MIELSVDNCDVDADRFGVYGGGGGVCASTDMLAVELLIAACDVSFVSDGVATVLSVGTASFVMATTRVGGGTNEILLPPTTDEAGFDIATWYDGGGACLSDWAITSS